MPAIVSSAIFPDPTPLCSEQTTAGASKSVVGDTKPPFGAPEVGEHISIRPPGVSLSRPIIVIGSLPAIVDPAIDRARTPECSEQTTAGASKSVVGDTKPPFGAPEV